MSGFRLLVVALMVVSVLGGCGGGGDDDTGWVVSRNAGVLEIGYGTGADTPQYAALHLSSGYLRLVPTRDAGWGTSVVVMPSFWSGGTYHQGTAVTALTSVQGDDLIIGFTGTEAGLQTSGQIRLSPPAAGQLGAAVSATTAGNITLDDRPGEAFKPVLLSSMHESDTVWDTQGAFAGGQTYPLPTEGWTISPPVAAETLGLQGGTSTWKTNAPTIDVTLDRTLQVTGWVTASDDPNDDNVAFWAAANRVLPSWSYQVVAREE